MSRFILQMANSGVDEVKAEVVSVVACSWNSQSSFVLNTAFAQRASKETFQTAIENGTIIVEKDVRDEEMTQKHYLAGHKTIISQLPCVSISVSSLTYSFAGNINDLRPAILAKNSGSIGLVGDMDELTNTIMVGAPAWYLLSLENETEYMNNPARWLSKQSIYVLNRINLIKKNPDAKH